MYRNLLKQAQICADGCKGGHHLVQRGIIWQKVFKCPSWPSAGCILTQHKGVRVPIQSVGWHHFPHNVCSQTEPSSTLLIPKK